MSITGATLDQVLGSLLGMAIGDALGMPVEGWSEARIRERYGAIESYHRRVFDDGAEIKAGEFTDESEIALCIVETYTVNGGVLDPENLAARMRLLARGESKRWMGAATLAGLDTGEREDWSEARLDEDGSATGDVAARGIPIGLVYAVGKANPAALRRDAEIAVRVTHGSPVAIDSAIAVALLVEAVAREPDRLSTVGGEVAEGIGSGSVGQALQRAQSLIDRGIELGEAIATSGTSDAAAEVVATALIAAASGLGLEGAALAAVNAGGATDARAALTGALLGAGGGASSIPQSLINDLEGRIYISLAAPWFYRTAQRRTHPVIDLRPKP